MCGLNCEASQSPPCIFVITWGNREPREERDDKTPPAADASCSFSAAGVKKQKPLPEQTGANKLVEGIAVPNQTTLPN
jgi:hypothetical protein